MRRTYFLAVATAVTVLSFAASATAATAANSDLRFEGTYRLIAAEPRPGSKAPHERHVVVDRHGHSVDVALPRGTRLQSGAKVRLTGKKSPGRPLLATAAHVVSAARRTPTPIAPTPIAPMEAVSTAVTPTPTNLAPTPANTQRVLVILASWTSPDAVTPESAADVFFGAANTWFTQASWGAMGLTGDVTPWLAIAGPDGDRCWANMGQTMVQAKAAALDRGFDSSTYDRTVIYFPKAAATSDCASYSGWAYQPGDVVWLNGTMDLGVVVHEQGHNLGLGHAHAWGCMEPNGLPATLTDRCDVLEYGDPSDAMGTSANAGFFSASRASALGWLPASRVADLTASGTATLSPREGTLGTAAIKATEGTRTYWVEYRTGAGVNSGTPLGSRGGALIRMQDGTRPETGLLDMSSDDRTFDTSVLPPGSSWVSPAGLRFTVGVDVGAGLSVSVARASVPTPPLSLGLRLKGSKLTLTWAAPASDGGAPISGYMVELGTSRVTVGASETSWSSGMLPSGTHTAKVSAINNVGTGPGATGIFVKR